MTRISMSSLAALSLVFCLCLIGGCKDTTAPPLPRIPPDLTQKEDVVYNLALSYNKADIAQYQKLLHEGYRFYNQTADVQRGMEQFRTRDWDINATTKMFLAAKGQLTADPAMNLDKLALEIRDGSWTAQDTVPGLGPCVDCWTTMRGYSLTLLLVGGQSGYMANGHVQIIVVPVDEGGKKLYKIYRMDDIGE